MQVPKGIGERDADCLFDAWLRDSKVSFGEAGLNPRGVILLPRNILHNSQANTRERAGQRMNSAVCTTAGLPRPQALIVAVQRRSRSTWIYLVSIRKPFFDGVGCH
ncbi:MAG: hypothetical protein L0226_14490 [Acidobacteria bacterium]|nr:hypothetical protein [Acidobacteriota bacterium]